MAAGDPRRPGMCLQRSLVDEQNDIYTPHAFASFVGVIARLALVEDGSFALCRVAGDVPAASAAVKPVARDDEVIGWLDDRSIAAVLPRAGEPRTQAVVAEVTAALGDRVRCVTGGERGALTARGALERLRSELQRATARTGAAPASA